ncbi:MAG: hypothetical protein JW395_2059 [Nitrospira sp.]|nr:hypothetical protein [Nitrospira sp.]
MGDRPSIHALALDKRHDRGLNPRLQDPPVIRPGFHEQSKSRQLGCPVVDLKAIQVLAQNQPGNILRPVSTLLIDRLKQVVGLDQDVG